MIHLGCQQLIQHVHGGGEQHTRDGSAPDVEMTRDFAYRPMLGEVEAMNGVDLFGGEHVAEGFG